MPAPRRFAPLILVLTLIVVASALAAPRTRGLTARAVRLLELLRQVDGAGSGLDADTVRGLAPDQLGSGEASALNVVGNLRSEVRSLAARVCRA